jgi:hypothetical protein
MMYVDSCDFYEPPYFLVEAWEEGFYADYCEYLEKLQDKEDAVSYSTFYDKRLKEREMYLLSL